MQHHDNTTYMILLEPLNGPAKEAEQRVLWQQSDLVSDNKIILGKGHLPMRQAMWQQKGSYRR